MVLVNYVLALAVEICFLFRILRVLNHTKFSTQMTSLFCLNSKNHMRSTVLRGYQVTEWLGCVWYSFDHPFDVDGVVEIQPQNQTVTIEIFELDLIMIQGFERYLSLPSSQYFSRVCRPLRGWLFYVSISQYQLERGRYSGLKSLVSVC